MSLDLLERLPAIRKSGQAAVLVTVVETHGSTPRKAGARMIAWADGRQEGTVGGGKVEHVVHEAVRRVLKTGQPETVHYKLTFDLAMCCGGQMSFLVEPVMPTPYLIVMGCGHVGEAVIYAAAPLGFDIIAVDDLPQNANAERLPQACRCVVSYEPADLEGLPFGDNTYIIIATREHALDQRLIELCLKKPFHYLGVIGSQRKARLQRERLLAKGFSTSDIERLHCPVGLDVGAETPAEIAVSICAELVQARRRASTGSDAQTQSASAPPASSAGSHP